ncbi:MAG: DUF1302 family protein [Candidatus Binatia bacterium]
MARRQAWLAGLAGGVVLLFATHAGALYLDEQQNITLRARIYSQAAIRSQDSQVFTVPDTFTGQLVQQRNFFNPEVDAKLTSYMSFMNGTWADFMSPDDFRFRIAAWGFYDGIYDYGSRQFDRQQSEINSTFSNTMFTKNQPPNTKRTNGYYVRGPNIKLAAMNKAATFGQVFPDFDLYDPRDIYAHQARVNELYLSYSKGPFFLRLGKQSISWGESDTVALLDQSNPFDLTLAAPGFFQDIDEARIPLYTVRTSYNLFDVLGPLSSGFVEGYWVPGGIDAPTSIVPLLTASPYSPRGVDPQKLAGLPGGVFPPSFQYIFIDHTPKSDISSSRWGVRFQSVVNRFLTLQTWVYRTFPQAPVPVKIGFQDTPLTPVKINGQNTFIVSLEHKPVMVYGLAGTFFSEWLDGIIRINTQFFEHEAGFIPQKNLNVCPQNGRNNAPCKPYPNRPNLSPNPISSPGNIPYANILRYELGFDRFFFFRPLNPTNSFILSASIVGSWNTSADNDDPAKHFRAGGQLKPGPVCTTLGTPGSGCPNGQARQRGNFQDDFVNAYEADAQGQITLQTDYMHGRLTPRLTYIQFVQGTAALHPTLTYRWNDWLLFQADYQYITGAYQSLGFFRDRDQAALRVTYQLN